MANVLIYTRLSTEDVNSSTDRQETACRSFAEVRGWTVVGTITDTSASAYQPSTKRPGFEALFTEARNRTCDGVLVWKFDRLVRQPADFERLWSVADKHSVFLASVMEPIDSSSPLGVAMLRIIVALAGLESATISTRTTASKRQAAVRGELPQHRCFGFAKDGSVIEEEAEAIREATARLLNGERTSAISADLTDRGYRTTKGTNFSPSFLRQMLRSPRLVGDRYFAGELLSQGELPAILDRDTYERLQSIVAVRAPKPRVELDWLLEGGFVTCGLCNRPLMHSYNGGKTAYRCPTPPFGCHRVSVSAPFVESWLLDRLADRIKNPKTRHLSAPNRRPMQLAAALHQLSTDYYVKRLIDRDEYFATRAAILETNGERSAMAPEQWRQTVFRSTDRRAAIDALTFERRRTLVTDYVDTVYVKYRGAGNRYPDPDRLSVQWRTRELQGLRSAIEARTAVNPGQP